MNPPPEKEAKRWLRQGEKDWDDAWYLFEGERYNMACFLAQQAAEKVLKAYLYFRDADEVWGHAVAELCSQAGEIDRDFVTLKIEAASLDKYYIPTRYPNGLPGGIPSEAYREADARLALDLSQKVINLVKNKIGTR